MRLRSGLLCGALLITTASLPAQTAQSDGKSAQNASPAQAVPVIDGGVGPCSLDLTITTQDGKPVAAASVKVHIAYGFGGFHKLDLEAGTNSDGKVRFTGLPSRVRRPPLEFNAAKEQQTGVATYDPATECHATHSVTLSKSSDANEKQN